MGWKVKGRITLSPTRISLASGLRNSGATEQNKMVWPISKPHVFRINKTTTARTWAFMLIMSLAHKSHSFSSADEKPVNFNFKTQQPLSSFLSAMRFFCLSSKKNPLQKSATWILYINILHFIYCSLLHFIYCSLLTAKTFWGTEFSQVVGVDSVPREHFVKRKLGVKIR